MNTGYEECDANFKRLKKYIDENELIRNIVEDKIKSSSVNYKEYFLNGSLSIPKNECDHIKVIYDYMSMIDETFFIS